MYSVLENQELPSLVVFAERKTKVRRSLTDYFPLKSFVYAMDYQAGCGFLGFITKVQGGFFVEPMTQKR